MFWFCSLYLSFNLINVNVKEFVNVSLFIGGHYASIIFFYGSEETNWIMDIPLCHDQCTKEKLTLEQNIVFFRNWSLSFVLGLQYHISKMRHHKKLLHQWIHVTSTSKINKSDILLSSFISLYVYIPIIFLRSSPKPSWKIFT